MAEKMSVSCVHLYSVLPNEKQIREAKLIVFFFENVTCSASLALHVNFEDCRSRSEVPES